jgi:magnesium transporter
MKKTSLKIKRRKVKVVDPKKIDFIGDQYMDESSIQLFTYDKNEYQERRDLTVDQISDFKDPGKVYWLNIHGLHDVGVIQSCCQKMDIHKLVIQDILDTTQRPKLQEFEDYLFFTIKSTLPQSGDELETEQISFILGRNYVMSFQEKKADHFEHIRQRIRDYKGISRERGPDFLLYLLLESIVDNYAETIEMIERRINKVIKLEEDTDPGPGAIHKIEQFREELFNVKISITPLKESISLLENEISDFIDQKHKKYFFDIKDQCLFLIDSLNALVQKLESGENLFFSYQGHRMNQVMKTLTVVATIFIPLTFIAGIYGMNFEYMPELKWEWAYFALWAVMVVLFLSLVIYFRRNKWF